MFHLRQKVGVAVAGALFLGSSLWASVPVRKFYPNRSIAGRGSKSATAEQYVLTEILGTLQAQAVDIADNKLIGGIYVDGDIQVTFVSRGSEFVRIQYPGAKYTLMGPASNSGITVGNWGSDTVQHASLYDVSAQRWIPLPEVDGKPINLGWRLSDAGTAVGSACEGSLSSTTNCVGWTWDGKCYTFFSVPWATSNIGTIPTSINNRGQIVGYYSDATGPKAFMYERGTFTTINAPGGVNSEAYDINNSGQILLWTLPDPSSPFGISVLYDRGTMTELPPFKDALVTFYMGLNDAGELVGIFLNPDFSGHAFIASKE